MPTIIGPKYSTDWRGKPPHMLAPDIPVWYRFLKEWADHFVSLYYDCMVGTQLLSEKEEGDPFKRMWRALTAKRIDAVAELEEEIWIIEVAEYPSMRHLAQLLVYQTLWLEAPMIDKPERLLLVGDKFDPRFMSSYEKFNIRVHSV